MKYKENKYLICSLCSHLGVYVELPSFLFWYRWERGTADQGFFFWKRLMPEPFFLGHANSCVYCVTNAEHICSYGKNMHEQEVMCEVLLLGTLCLDMGWGMEASGFLSPGRYLLFCFCCLMLFDAVWCISLTGLGVLEERMMWSGLWF